MLSNIVKERLSDYTIPNGTVIIERDGDETRATIYCDDTWRGVKIPTRCAAWGTYLESIESVARALVRDLINDDEDNMQYRVVCD